jgi:hypothetical protein
MSQVQIPRLAEFTLSEAEGLARGSQPQIPRLAALARDDNLLVSLARDDKNSRSLP